MTEKETKNQTDKQKKNDDAWLWGEATKDVQPLSASQKGEYNALKGAQAQLSSAKKPNHSEKFAENSTPQINQKLNMQGSAEMDKRTARRLKRGKFSIDARLDLHGFSQAQAYDAINSFIPNMYHQGKRCILIITGKGASKSGRTPLENYKPGVLKQKTPGWLNEGHLQQYILKVQDARPEHGGAGALYVLLRRRRN